MFTPIGEATRRITRGSGSAADSANRVTRIPAGHPEGYLEGFATIYCEIAAALRAHREGVELNVNVLFPTGDDGLRGVAFIEAAIESSAEGSTWVNL